MINQYEFAGWLGVANKSYSWMLLGLYVVPAMFADKNGSMMVCAVLVIFYFFSRFFLLGFIFSGYCIDNRNREPARQSCALLSG